MGVLEDMLDDAGGQPRPASTFGDVVARAVGARTAPRPAAEAPSLEPLLGLDDGVLRRLIRYLPAEAMVPLLARASVPVAQRLVGLLDAESQSWLAAQSDAIESCTPEAHANAARQALALVERARSAGPAPAPAPAATRRPVEVGFAFNAPPAAESPAPAAVTVSEPPPPARPEAADGDDVVETLATLVSLAAGRSPSQLRELAEAADHPVLSAGLRQVSAGASSHEIDEAVRHAGRDWIADQERRIELMRLAVLAIRFGDGPERFRSQAAGV